MKELKPSSAPIPIDSNVTPITHDTIKPVHGVDWGTMTLGELLDQKTILQARLFAAFEMNKPEIATQIETGIATIDALIKQKGFNTEGIIT